MRVYVLGNPLAPSDSLPLRILEKLKLELPDISFAEFDPSEELPLDEPLVFLDTATGLDEVKVLSDIGRILGNPRFSMHDFGLGAHLKLLRKLGRLPEVAIVCVPQGMGEGRAVEGVRDRLRELKASVP